MRAWRHASAYDPRRGTVAAWLLTIARNVSINMLRAWRFDPIDPDVLLALEAKRPREDGAEAQRVDSELLREPLAQLPGDQRRAWSWPSSTASRRARSASSMVCRWAP